jgi:ASC-1-like (ASCH) protein
MKIWKLNLYHHIYSYVESGKKSVEGRAWSKKRDYRKMKRGDKIIFSDLESKKKVVAVIDQVKWYKSVKEYLRKEGLKKCLPWAKSLAEGIGIYYGIADDWEERIRNGGIFAIRIRVEKSKVR